LWAMVQRGRLYLDGKRAEGETAAEADAGRAEVFGQAHQPEDPRARDLSLLELAYERVDDWPSGERVEASHLLDLEGGAVYSASTSRPLKGSKGPEQRNYLKPLAVKEACVLPGFLNRPLQWEAGAEELKEWKPAHLKAAYGHARPAFKPVLDESRRQLAHPLAARVAVLLLRCERVGKVGERVVLEDAAGDRIEALDRRRDYSNVANLVRAAGMLLKDRPAMLCRLFLQTLPNTIAAEPLAALTAKHHLRLGL